MGMLLRRHRNYIEAVQNNALPEDPTPETPAVKQTVEPKKAESHKQTASAKTKE